MIYDVVIVPLAYVLWLGKLYYSAIPQWILWSVLLVAADSWPSYGICFRRAGPRAGKNRSASRPEGPVEALAVWIVKSRHGNYFKWQLANRLGRIARRLQ